MVDIVWGEEEQGSGRNFPREREMRLSGLYDDEWNGVCEDEVWLARREMRNFPAEALAEDGVVTLSGEHVAVYAQGERRYLPVYGPGGYCWRPMTGDQVLVLKLGQEGEQCCVAGTRAAAPEELAPGEVMLRSGGGGCIWLKNDGTVELTGVVKINGEKYKPCECGSGSNDKEEESGGEESGTGSDTGEEGEGEETESGGDA